MSFLLMSIFNSLCELIVHCCVGYFVVGKSLMGSRHRHVSKVQFSRKSSLRHFMVLNNRQIKNESDKMYPCSQIINIGQNKTVKFNLGNSNYPIQNTRSEYGWSMHKNRQNKTTKTKPPIKSGVFKRRGYKTN